MSKKFVFLRGLGRGSVHWGEFRELFQKANPGVETEWLDLPGNGALHTERTPVNPARAIANLRGRCSFTKGEPAKFQLCGLSLGGMIALEWAKEFPDEIEAVTVINTSLPQCSHFNERLQLENFHSLVSIAFGNDSHKRESDIFKLTSMNLRQQQKHLQHFVQFGAEHPVSVMNLFRQLVLASRVEVRALPMPLHVVYSKRDQLVHPKCSVRIAEALNAKVTTHENAGHDLPLDDPSWLVQLLK